VIDETIGDQLRVTVIATGFDHARVTYPDQTQNYVNMNMQNQFAGNNAQSNMQSMPQIPPQYMGINPAARSQGNFASQIPQPMRPYDMRAQPQIVQQNQIPQNPFIKPVPAIIQRESIPSEVVAQPVKEMEAVHPVAPQTDDNTESALRIAKELSDIEIDDMDFVTPGERN
jgi:hypothetical protein